MADVIRVLGIDPGSRTTGYGIVELSGQKSRYIDCGCINTGRDNLAIRLRNIFVGVEDVIKVYQPDVFAIESVFVHKNVSSALKLGQARGAAICAAAMHNLDVEEYSPKEIKKAVVGTGTADKEQVQYMIRLLLSLPQAPSSDAADALAVAICHGTSRLAAARLSERNTPSSR